MVRRGSLTTHLVVAGIAALAGMDAPCRGGPRPDCIDPLKAAAGVSGDIRGWAGILVVGDVSAGA